MLSRAKTAILRDESGAIAPTFALSLFALVAAGGIGFDYARLAAMDSELQNAADQAALAAVGQLDGQPGACSRASGAAVGLVANRTLLANEVGGNRNIVVTAETACDATGRIRFWQNSTKTTAANSDANARFVEVQVNARTARYALTPIVGAMSSGAIDATAFAGLGSAICKVPPVMICNPGESGGNLTFDASTYIGKGIRLVSVGGGNGSWAPGNFGYLNSGGGSNGAPGLREALGWSSPPGDCIGQTGVNTKPGASVSVTDALNTRFDIYDSNVSCPTGGACPASINSRKDVARAGNANGGNSCRLHNQGWQEVAAAGRYLPSSATAALPVGTTPLALGHPRDMCHSVTSGTSGYCTTPVGDGLWDRDAYFRANYVRTNGTRWTASEWRANTGLSTSVATTASNYASRYNVYAWEIANRGSTVDGVTVLAPRITSGAGPNALRSYGLPVCSPTAGYGAGTVPAATTVDRRRISIAVINCTANSVNGNSTNVPVLKWIEMFLVEPSIARDRTNAGDVYAEVIGETTAGGAGATAGQVVRKDTPYLIE